MKKTVLVRGPVHTQSGYGEHTRFVLRALRRQEEYLDINIVPTNWGATGWRAEDTEERRWIDERIATTATRLSRNEPFDISIQVTIPNEWERISPINIGVTAGIESNRVSAEWLQKANMMDKVITISEHSKLGFTSVSYTGTNDATGEQQVLKCTSPVEISHYPVKTFESLPSLELGLDYDFNYLAIAQLGPRKNLENMIKWFVEENFDQEVGLVVKTSIKNNSIVDRSYTEDIIRSVAGTDVDRKCKVYLLHGDLTSEQIHSLYLHPQIKCMVSTTHGEGFGLPLFEAAYSGLPIVAPGYSGQCDFLYMPTKSKTKKKKSTKKPFFAEIDFTMGPIGAHAVWPGVLEEGTMWAHPTEASFKKRIRQVRKDYNKWLKKSTQLKEWVCEEFESEKMHEKLSSMLYKVDPEVAEWMQELEEMVAID